MAITPIGFLQTPSNLGLQVSEEVGTTPSGTAEASTLGDPIVGESGGGSNGALFIILLAIGIPLTIGIGAAVALSSSSSPKMEKVGLTNNLSSPLNLSLQPSSPPLIGGRLMLGLAPVSGGGMIQGLIRF